MRTKKGGEPVGQLRNKTGLTIGLIIGLVVVIDIFLMLTVSNRPLKAPARDPAGVPELNVAIEAAPVTREASQEIIPQLEFFLTDSSGSEAFDVLGYGFDGNNLYLIVRLFQDVDFSLSKGWGKAFQLEDSKGKRWEYPCSKLPNAVDIHDPFIDLPNDLRAKQVVVNGGYRELCLIFENYPKNSVPHILRIIEDFQGDSPANPGITYEEEVFEVTGKKALIGPVKSMPVGVTNFTGRKTGEDGLLFAVEKLWIDQQYRPNLELSIQAPTATTIKLSSAVLADEQNRNYGFFDLSENTTLTVDNSGTKVSLMFEPLPETVKEIKLYLNYLAADRPRQAIIELQPRSSLEPISQ